MWADTEIEITTVVIILYGPFFAEAIQQVDPFAE
jgi:hypothetical protein